MVNFKRKICSRAACESLHVAMLLVAPSKAWIELPQNYRWGNTAPYLQPASCRYIGLPRMHMQTCHHSDVIQILPHMYAFSGQTSQWASGHWKRTCAARSEIETETSAKLVRMPSKRTIAYQERQVLGSDCIICIICLEGPFFPVWHCPMTRSASHPDLHSFLIYILTTADEHAFGLLLVSNNRTSRKLPAGAADRRLTSTPAEAISAHLTKP
eukprot:366409-Chlamydomonas_euryale.AAC.1